MSIDRRLPNMAVVSRLYVVDTTLRRRPSIRNRRRTFTSLGVVARAAMS